MKNHKIQVLLFSILLSAVACEKGFEELNKNPFFPTQTEIGPLFNSVIESLQLSGNEQLYLHNNELYPVTQQLATSGKIFDNPTIGTENMWSDYYSALVNIRELEKRFAEAEGDLEVLNNVRAQVKIILAYKTFRMTDVFGDIPFFDAGKGFESVDNLEPKFDSQEAIYKFLLDDLEEADKLINTDVPSVTASGAAYISFGNFDNFFDDDMILWQKFGNSLRLRHAMRMVEKDAAFATPILKNIIENNLPVIEEGEDVGLYPEKLSWQKTSTYWSFREHKKMRMGSNVWNCLSENDDLSGSGIYDPRAYIWFEPNQNGEWAPYPQIDDADTPASGGSPYQELRDVDHSFKGDANIYAPMNYYLVRDEAAVPEIILTAAEVQFIKAEAYLRGLGVAVDENQAMALYTEAVVGSIEFWQNIVTTTPIWENKPAILSIGQIFAAANHPNIEIFSASDKLTRVYKQRWLDAMRQPWEAYALTRRTQNTPREGDFPTHYRMAYPPSEQTNNPNKWAEQVDKMGQDSEQVKVWWME